MRWPAVAPALHGRTWRHLAVWLLLLAASSALHLWDLGGRSFHHDEAIHAKLSLDLAERGDYRYDPTYHGPLLYYATAATFLVAGDTDFTARLPIAIAGIAMLWVAWRLRRRIGEGAAWWTGVLFTISPLFLFYGRFLRMDLLEAVTASAALIALDRALRGSERAWIAFGAWTGLAVATKENAYVTAAVVCAAIFVVATGRRLARGGRGADPGGAGGGVFVRIVHGLRAVVAVPAAVARDLLGRVGGHLTGLVTAGAAFVLVTVPLYTVGFSSPRDWMFPVRAISYWWGQHEVQRVGGPWWFHLPRLAQYELLVLVCATVWVVRRRRRLRTVEAFLYALGVCSVVMYAYLGEKVPWLGVHQVWPFVPLAGAQLARTFGRHGRWWSRTLGAAGLAATLAASLCASFVLDEISPRDQRVESLHFVQTTPEMAAVAAEGLHVEGGDGGAPLAVSGEAAWPLNWYWRHRAVWWGRPLEGSRPGLVVCDPADERDVRRLVGPGYDRQRVPLRAWWLMELGDPGALDVLRYMVTRRYWGRLGSTDVVILRRERGAVAPRPRTAAPPEELRRALGVSVVRVLGEGMLEEARGVDLRGGRVAVADPALSRVVVMDIDGAPLAGPAGLDLDQPEDVRWDAAGGLWIADTWHHRVLHVPAGGAAPEELPAPPGGWYGPRSLDLADDGRLVVADTGNRRLVLYDASGALERTIGGGAGEVGLLEPVGVAWLGDGSVVVCDTGHRRLVVVDGSGAEVEEVPLEGAWSDFYSRPQVAVLGPRRWLVSDTPGAALWLVDDGAVTRLAGDGETLVPTGLAWDPASRRLLLGDLWGKVWLMEVGDGAGP